MSSSDPVELSPWEPRWPRTLALVVFVLAALTLCYPMLGGRWLLGDDQFLSGYAFRFFGAEMFRSTGHIPEWNPYILGGLPFIAAMHGDIFYPTAWLRWILPVDTAMNIGFAVHIVLAGLFMYLFLRALKLGWTAALAGGLAYELTGAVTSIMRPGHDGKLYVSALAPLALFALLRAIRHRRFWGYPLFSLVIGLCIISPQFQMTYYLLVFCGLWVLYLVFGDPERPAGGRWWVPLALSAAAVGLALGISALQVLPFYEYLPYSPRGVPGSSSGWAYATLFAMPPSEIFTTFLPQFNGMLEHYWGANAFKTNSEYVGILVLILGIIGAGSRGRRPLVWALGGIGLLFLLVAFGGHTPFYRLWYEVMPFMKKVRAEGMAFLYVALVVAVFAAFGVERLLRREIRWGTVALIVAPFAIFGLLGAVGALQPVTETLAVPEMMRQVAGNAEALRSGSVRLLIFLALSGVALWMILAGLLRGSATAAVLAVILVADLWSIDHYFFEYRDRASVVFREDELTRQIKQDQPPFRVLDAQQVYGQGSFLMALNIQKLLGYHGQELRFFDDLMGGKNVWSHVGKSYNLFDLFGVRYILTQQEAKIPGYHKVLGPVPTAMGTTGLLYQQDSVAPYVRVVASAAKIPEDQLVSTVVDPRFPYDRVVVLPDSSSLRVDPVGQGELPQSPVGARLTSWVPGKMEIALTGSSPKQTYLLIGENWYTRWHATVNGAPVKPVRGDNALLTIPLAPGAKVVHLWYHDPSYVQGKWITGLSVLLAGILILAPVARRRAAGA